MAENTNYHVLLLGDSTLDNLVWVKGQEETVTHHLGNLLGTSSRISNFAADGFTSEDTLHGCCPRISYRARLNAGDPFPTLDLGKNEAFKPLNHIKSLEGVTHAVLSVGGNDVREILGNLGELPQRLSGFLKNYPQIVDKVTEVTPNLILMLQYRPSYNQDNVYSVYRALAQLTGGNSVGTLNALMEEIYPPVLKLAKDKKLAIIDLPNTFDIKNDSLYCAQIEPSNEGGKLIAKLIAHVIKHHEFTGPSKFYSMKGEEIKEKVNDGSRWIIEPKSSQDEMYNQMIKGLISKGTK